MLDMFKNDTIFTNPNIYIDYNSGHIYQLLKQEEIDKIEETYNLFDNNKDLVLITFVYIFLISLIIFYPLIKYFFNNTYNTLLFTSQVCKFFYIMKMLF